MIVTAVDPGTAHAGVSTIELTGNNIRLIKSEHVQRLKDETEAQFLVRLSTAVELQAIILRPASIIACEAAHYRANHKTHAALAKAIGVVEHKAAEFGIKYIEVQPAEWKLAVTGSGKSKYPVITRMLAMMLGKSINGIKHLSEHELAAIGIAICASRKAQTAARIGGK